MFKKIFTATVLSVFMATCGILFGGHPTAAAQNNYDAVECAYVTEYSTGKVVFKKCENEKKPIASMVKIMTSLLTLEAIDRGDVSETDLVEVSEHAASMGGSQVFLKAGNKIKLTELLKSVVVASANDSAVALAEHLGGSEDGFVSLMNRRAAELDMTSTNFVNATGLPAQNSYSTARDVNVMTGELIKFPLYKKYCSIWLEDFVHPDGRTTVMTNTNKLVRFYKGCDSGKTGFTSEAMYCLSASAQRNGVRIIATVTGAKSSKERNKTVSELFDLGFSKFEARKVFSAGDTVAEAKVSRGKSKTVALTILDDVKVVVERGSKAEFRTETFVPAKLKAPIAKGDEVGKLTVYSDGKVVAEATLYAASDVEKASLWDKIRNIGEEW